MTVTTETSPDKQAAKSGKKKIIRGVLAVYLLGFVVIGGVNTLIGLGWFLLFHWLVGGVVGYLGTLLLAHVCSVLCAFVLHRRLVFRVRGNVLTDLGRFELVNLGGLGLNAVALTFFVEVAGLPVLHVPTKEDAPAILQWSVR